MKRAHTRIGLIPALLGAALFLGACAGTLPTGLKLPPELATRLAQSTAANPVVELTGAIDAMAADAWTVGGKVVSIRPGTDIKGNFALGDNVKVQADITESGDLEAQEIDAAGQGAGDQGNHLGQELEFKGKIDAMAADSWTVDGKVLLITPDTKIDGTFNLGDEVKVQAVIDANGNLVAREIQAAKETNQQVTETPEPTETPEATETPEGTEAPEATEASEADKVEFTGKVDAMAADMWTIDGKQVAVNAGTEIKGTIQVGDMVNVEAVKAADGSLTAVKIHLVTGDSHEGEGDQTEIVGPLESMAPGVWMVGGHTIIMTANTEIRGAPVIGMIVKVHVNIAPDGTLTALEVDLANGDQHRDGGSKSGSGGSDSGSGKSGSSGEGSGGSSSRGGDSGD